MFLSLLNIFLLFLGFSSQDFLALPDDSLKSLIFLVLHAVWSPFGSRIKLPGNKAKKRRKQEINKVKFFPRSFRLLAYEKFYELILASKSRSTAKDELQNMTKHIQDMAQWCQTAVKRKEKGNKHWKKYFVSYLVNKVIGILPNNRWYNFFYYL